jgi:hypothetical protein
MNFVLLSLQELLLMTMVVMMEMMVMDWVL